MIVIFDFDGTLHPTDTIYGYAVRKVLRELSSDFSLETICQEKTTVTDRELSKYLGVNAEEMWEDFLPGLPREMYRDVIAKVGNYMIEAILSGNTKLYEGMIEILDFLKAEGHTLLILSNCTKKYMEAQKKAHHLERWFTDFYCSEAYGNAPKEIIFDEIKKKYSGQYVIIGDRKSDIQVAITHHLKSVGCGYGYGSREELESADVVVGSIREIKKCI